MPVRHTIQDMREIAQLRGGKCHSKEYVNQFTPLKWMCAKGHTWDLGYKFIQQGAWCNQCLRNESRSDRLEYLREVAKERGGKVLSKEYINKNTHIEFQCKEGHRWKTSPHSVTIGKSWCPRCSGNAKHTMQDMHQLALKRGGKCLSKKYVNVKTKLKWQCDKGHEWMAQPGSIRRGSWCAKCGSENGHFNQRTDIKVYQKLAEERGGKLLSKTYISSKLPLKWKCSKGHIWHTPAGSIKYGHWCPYCAGKAPHTIKEMKKFAAKRGGKCLSEKYVNIDTKLKWQCAKGHTWMAMPTNVIHNNSWCERCYNKIRVKNLGAYALKQ